jgi:hypothetical protein
LRGGVFADAVRFGVFFELIADIGCAGVLRSFAISTSNSRLSMLTFCVTGLFYSGYFFSEGQIVLLIQLPIASLLEPAVVGKIHENISAEAELVVPGQSHLSHRNHESVNHAMKEYVRGNIHTIEKLLVAV